MIEKLCYVCMIVLLIILQLTQVLSIAVFFLSLGVLALILALRIGIFFHQTQLALLVNENMPAQLQQQRRKQTAILALLLAVLFFVLAYIS
ncbi:hypothetical protein ABM135_10855 [Enterococcus cecorum]|uniref:hypothetical protein n=1 Tax=Enterococcus cecorum TaxID=44008 RepID=UPI0032C476D5